MLFQILRNIFSRKPSQVNVQIDKLISNNNQNDGDSRNAIHALREHLKSSPLDVWALNNLGCCLTDIGDDDGAAKLFELAFSIDDSYLPVVINHAKFLCDRHKSADAIDFLRQAKNSDPSFPNVDAVYGGLCLSTGNPELARNYTRRAWLAAFDSLRFANCYLLYCAYDDIDEYELAAEHAFWGGTLLPIPKKYLDDNKNPNEIHGLPQSLGKIRIGYWSPDFRNHSVRYFFRPLLESHDKNRFEIILYHDFPLSDTQTENIKSHADYFFEVNDLTDEKLLQLIASHKLDVLVELAGHTSTNRLNLLQERLATLQISAIGYPPTTGLSTIDAKLIDKHIDTCDSQQLYLEAPLALPNSFWCFDPKEESNINPKPPAIRNGFVTFGCIGNIAKINKRILDCWSKILNKVPKSRLQLRSISFDDPAAQEYIRVQLDNSGIPFDRVDLYKPAAGRDFFESYNDIDIILDTYPFNGGTTTCFATYMGVPVVSLAGKSLISRMGKSILNNIGLNDFSVETSDAYINKAVSSAANIDFLSHFRTHARNLFTSTPLGNGNLFTKDFESACEKLLSDKKLGNLKSNTKSPVLASQEIIRRAYTVLRTGQHEAATRIVDYCLQHYPNSGSAHILRTQEFTRRGNFEEAATYLLARLSNFSPSEQIASLINITRNYLQSDKPNQAKTALEQAQKIPTTDPYDLFQFRMLEACLHVKIHGCNGQPKALPIITLTHIDIYVICDDNSHFKSINDSLISLNQNNKNIQLTIVQCSESRRSSFYRSLYEKSKSDIFLYFHKNIQIYNPSFFLDITTSLENHDIIGVAGARSWDRIDWRFSASENKASSYITPSDEKPGSHEIHATGFHKENLVDSISVLDGSLIAVHRRTFNLINHDNFDEALEGGCALMEEYFCHRAYLSGARLGVHLSLGVVIDWRVQLLNKHIGEARCHLADLLNLDPFEQLVDDRTIFSAPINSPSEGFYIQRILKD